MAHATTFHSLELHVRPRAAQDLEHGTRMIWEQVSNLLAEKWKLDDVFAQRRAFLCMCFLRLALSFRSSPRLSKTKGNNRGREGRGNGK